MLEYNVGVQVQCACLNTAQVFSRSACVHTVFSITNIIFVLLRIIYFRFV